MATRAVLALLLFASATAWLPAQSPDAVYVIRDVRVFDGEGFAERQTVVIIDAHIHLPAVPVTYTSDALRQSLAFGVTTSIVMWAGPSQFTAQVSGSSGATRHR